MKSQLDHVTRTVRVLCGAGLLLTAVGCGAALPGVSGTVTLDGQPLPNATVIFMPRDETQSPAQGTTDARGNFTLEQELGAAGIQTGEYSVRITTFQPGSQNLEPAIPAIKERVPARYNVDTELNAVVGAEQNSAEGTFDFELKSGGPIFQPSPDAF